MVYTFYLIDGACTRIELLPSWKSLEHFLIYLIYFCISGTVDGMLQKELVHRSCVGGGQGVIQRKVVSFTNIRQPLLKLCTLGILRINMHVFGEMMDVLRLSELTNRWSTEVG